MQKAKYSIGNVFVKTDTGALYKIIKIKFIDKIYHKEKKATEIIEDWLYDCETVQGDNRPYVRLYELRLNSEYYQVPNDSEAVQAIYG